MFLKQSYRLLFLFIISCDYPSTEEPKIDLELFMNYEYSNGLYYLNYPAGAESSYGRVHYITEPITRIFWTSLDSFTFIYWGQEYTEPIINNSTYSDAEGNGQQLFYLYPAHIGDTLDIIASVNNQHQVISCVIR
tara:strand:+ start:189 stop:593 length:405 start_codon:yes stop_codon:yes gene_type:complete